MAQPSHLHHQTASLESTVSAEVRDVTWAGGEGFAASMRERTKLVHREAERSGVFADLLRGRADRRAYALLLRNLVPVYDALETALVAARDEPLVAPFAADGIRRLPFLVRDVTAIGGSDWDRSLPRLAEADAYAGAIRQAAADENGRLVAHAYARYLGDLSGGQILRPLLARTLGLANDELAFYDFPEIADLELQKTVMRRALDTIPTASALAEAVVEEAIGAFRHNIALSLAVSRAA